MSIKNSPSHCGALHNVRVLDLSRVLAGPWAAQTLGDLGAQVVKVERPGAGDDTRAWGPPFVLDSSGLPTMESAYYMCTNRNKQSIAIDITKPEGQRLIQELAQNADVLIENFKTGGLTQYGLDYTTLNKLNPRLIYCSITGFGHTGPYAKRPGYDFLIQAMGGLMSVTGKPDSESGGGPIKVGVALVDIMTGLYATNAILAALQARNHTGRGQHIDMALMDVQVACLANQAMNYLYGGTEPSRMGNAHPNTVPYQDFPTSDGYMILAIGNDAQFARFCNAIECPQWAVDKRFATNEARLTNRSELISMISGQTVKRSTHDWVSLLEHHAVPCGPINTVAEVFADQHVQARKLLLEIEHSAAGLIPMIASPIRLSDTPVSYRHSPPQLGEHTDEILSNQLKLDNSTIASLRKRGIVA